MLLVYLFTIDPLLTETVQGKAVRVAQHTVCGLTHTMFPVTLHQLPSCLTSPLTLFTMALRVAGALVQVCKRLCHQLGVTALMYCSMTKFPNDTFLRVKQCVGCTLMPL